MHFHIYVMDVLLLEHFNTVMHVMLYLSAVYYLDSMMIFMEPDVDVFILVWTHAASSSQWEEAGTLQVSFIVQKYMWNEP